MGQRSLEFNLEDLKKQEAWNEAVCNNPYMLRHVPGQYMMQEMCNRAVDLRSCQLEYVPNILKTQEMCNKAVKEYPWSLGYVPDQYKAQEVCEKAVEKGPWLLKDVPDGFKTLAMCDNAVRNYPFSLGFVSDWLVSQQQIKIWRDNNYVYNDEWLIKWYEAYKKRKAQKAQIKKELIPIAWHPSRHWDWCTPEDEKKKQKNCGSKHRLFYIL